MSLDMRAFIETVRDRAPEADVRVILDAGAFDAADTALLSAAWPGARAIAIEGDPQTYRAHIGHVPDGVEYVLAALWRLDGITKAWHEKSGPKLNGFFDHKACGSTRRTLTTTRRLDTLLPELGVHRVDVMKLDVEGASREVLEGMGALLKTVTALHVETETEMWFPGQQHLHPDVAHFLEQAGFEEVGGFYDGGQADTIWMPASPPMIL